MQVSNELVSSVEFTPYDPTQDVIFPPELMVSLMACSKEILENEQLSIG